MNRVGVAFLGGAALRALLLPFPGYADDVSTGETWELALVKHGTHLIYQDPTVSGPVIYGPVALYFFWAVGLLHEAFAPGSPIGSLVFRLLTKAPAVVSDLLLAWLLYVIARRTTSECAARLVAYIALFAPPFWLATAYWGQNDSVQTVFIAGALLLALEDRFTWAWTALVASFMIKPQAALIAPVLVLWQVHRTRMLAVASLAEAWSVSSVFAYFAALPFVSSTAPWSVFLQVAMAYSTAFSQWSGASVSAFNLWTITLPEMADESLTIAGLNLSAWGLVLTLSILLFVCFHTRGTRVSILLASVAALATPYFVATRMHERYLFPALSLGLIAGAIDQPTAWIIAAMAGVFAIDLLFVLNGIQVDANHPLILMFVHVLSAINVLLFLVLLCRCALRSRKASAESSETLIGPP